MKRKIKKIKYKTKAINIEKLDKYKTWEEVSKAYEENKINNTELLLLLELFKFL